MDTLHIERLAIAHNALSSCFHGVYPLDGLPNHLQFYPAALVVNTHPRHKRGEHWVAIFVNSKRRAVYFDSYGLPPLKKRLVTFLNRNTSRWTYSSKVLQHPLTVLCGGYCLYFLVKKAQGHSLVSILSSFKHDLELNDRKIYRFLKRLETTNQH